MRGLVRGFEDFYTCCCSYLLSHHDSGYTESELGIPKEYIRMRDKKLPVVSTSVQNNKKKKNHRRGTYIFNKHAMIATESKRGPQFKFDGVNAFRHKKKSNVRVSTRGQRFSKPPEISTDYYFELDNVFKNFDEFDLSSHVVVDGNFETNKVTIQQQIDCRNFTDSPLPDQAGYEVMRAAVRDTIRKLQIVNLGDVNISDLHDFSFNLDTKPGFRYENYLCANKKADCVDVAVSVAEERYKKIVNATKQSRHITRDEIIPGVYTIGARNQRRDGAEIGEVAKSRPVHIPEWHTELHGGIFSDRILAHIVERETGPIYIGNSFIRFERLEEQIKSNYSALEGDWSKFDASLCNTLITMAVSVLRLYFPPGLLYDNHFLAILDSLVVKDYHVVGGSVLRILHGVPSGSKWTGLITSIINLLVLNFCFSSVKYNDRSFAIGGDDFVAFVRKGSYDLDSVEEMVYDKAEGLRMKLKYLKRREYKNSKNVDDYPIFYKYTVFEGKPVVPHESVMERILSPWAKKYMTTPKVLKFLDEVLPSLAYPTSSCFVYYTFYIYCYFRVTGVRISVSDIAARHKILFDKMLKDKIGPECFKDKYFISNRSVFSNFVKLNDYSKTLFLIHDA
jgi:hypothetical protein